MLKIFKTVDDKIEKLGFTKIKDNDYIVAYERRIKYQGEDSYTQAVDICHKQNGRHIIQSYDIDLYDSRGIGNTCVGLTYKETKLFLKKMKQKKWIS